MTNTDTDAATPDRIATRIEQVCAEIDRLLADLRRQAQLLKETGDDGTR